MTIWHFKGEKISEEGREARYRFYPDHVMAPDVTGELTVNVDTWEYEIVRPARAEEMGLVSTDGYCVSALVHKLEKAGPEELPAEVYFIA